MCQYPDEIFSKKTALPGAGSANIPMIFVYFKIADLHFEAPFYNGTCSRPREEA
jgi:hypothetical protein